MRLIEYYRAQNGALPYKEWLETLPWKIAARIDAYVDRVALGGSKTNLKPIRDEMYEIKIDIGQGYRVYFGRNNLAVILLYGGNKSSQSRDIEMALKYWRDFCAKNR